MYLIASWSTLTLLVARVGADHADNTVPTNHLALAAHALDRCCYFHAYFSEIPTAKFLLGPENNTALGQIVGRQLNGHLVPRQYADVMHTHLSRDMAQDDMAILQLHPERCVWEVFLNLPLHLDNVFLCHAINGPGIQRP